VNRELAFANVDAVCQQVMTGVVAVIRNSGKTVKDYDQAVRVMREEIKALILGEDYTSERTALLRGSISEKTVMALVVTNCLAKIHF
jgi:hypothetical protein